MSKLKEFWATIACGVLIVLGWQLERMGMTNIAPFIFVAGFIIGGYAQAKEGITDTIETKQLNVELLMVLSGIGASIIGYWFEGAILIFIFSLSGALERYTTDKSKHEISKLMELQPENAQLKLADGTIKTVPVESLNIGDLLLVRTGEKCPIDGKIVEGRTTIDESAVTGEPIPTEKGMDSEVYGGTVNLTGVITLEVTKRSDETLFSNIVRLVEQAQSVPSQAARFIESFERQYVKFVLIFVAIMMILPHYLVGWDWETTIYRAMVLLIVASPCALVASVTPASLAAISNGARNGILFKGAVHLENLSQLKAIAFDKTGTLTEGKPVVTNQIFSKALTEQEIIEMVVTMEQQSTHPLAEAVIQAYGGDINRLEDVQVEDIPGWGVKAETPQATWKIGKKDWFSAGLGELCTEAEITALKQEGKTLIYVGKDDHIVAIIALKDTARAEARETVQALIDRGITPVMITGDNEETGKVIGKELGMTHIIGNCLPEEKVNGITALKEEFGEVGMIGDGINDAPALANASVGIAMGAGTDIAMEAADIVLIQNHLNKLVYAYDLSNRLKKIIWQNIIFSVIVILCLITANLFQFMNLPLGVIGHEGSTILVILNGLRLLRNR